LFRFFRYSTFCFVLALAAGCGGKGGPANPPTDLAAEAGDGQVTLTWTMEPGVEYWVFYAPAPSISLSNWRDLPGVKYLLKQQSPAVISGLANGTSYAFTVNGRYDGGPGGAGAPSVSATPRLAGAVWTAGAAFGSSTLNAAAYGKLGTSNVFLTAGLAGTLASSPDGVTWTALANPAPAADLYGVALGGSGTAAAVGAGGVIVSTTDGAAWTADVSPVGSSLLALASNGSGAYVGVGVGGAVVHGSAGSWNSGASGTLNDLRAVTYGNSMFVAVGAAGTVLTSTDGGASWTTRTSGTGAALLAVTYGTDASSGSGVFVAAGAGGVLLTSPDGLSWTAQTPLPVTAVNSLTWGTQFVLVGDGGIVYTSTDALTWQVRTSGTAVNLKSVTHNAFSYVAVGDAGTNLLAK